MDSRSESQAAFEQKGRGHYKDSEPRFALLDAVAKFRLIDQIITDILHRLEDGRAHLRGFENAGMFAVEYIEIIDEFQPQPIDQGPSG